MGRGGVERTGCMHASLSVRSGLAHCPETLPPLCTRQVVARLQLPSRALKWPRIGHTRRRVDGRNSVRRCALGA